MFSWIKFIFCNRKILFPYAIEHIKIGTFDYDELKYLEILLCQDYLNKNCDLNILRSINRKLDLKMSLFEADIK